MATKRDFEETAAILRETCSAFPTQQTEVLRRALAYRFAETFKASNPLFKEGLFLRACGIVETETETERG